MTHPDTLNQSNSAGVVQRLRKVEGTSPDSIGISTCWHRNPDGPEAADTIEELLEPAQRLIAAIDELQSMTVAERIITGRSDRDIRETSNKAIADLRAAIAKVQP